MTALGVTELFHELHVCPSLEPSGEIVMSIVKWEKPVQISVGSRGSEFVSSAFDAVLFLKDSWEDSETVSFLQARNACRGALAGRVDAEVARAKFLEAVTAAKMRVH